MHKIMPKTHTDGLTQEHFSCDVSRQSIFHPPQLSVRWYLLFCIFVDAAGSAFCSSAGCVLPTFLYCSRLCTLFFFFVFFWLKTAPVCSPRMQWKDSNPWAALTSHLQGPMGDSIVLLMHKYLTVQCINCAQDDMQNWLHVFFFF